MRAATASSGQLRTSSAKVDRNALGTHDSSAYDAWFRVQVQEALNDVRPAIPHQQVMDEVQVLIDRKRRAHA